MGTGKYPFFLILDISTQHSRVRRGWEVMKVIIFWMNEFPHSPHKKKKTSPQVNSEYKKIKNKSLEQGLNLSGS